MRSLLDAIGSEEGTDKASYDHNYLAFYERQLSHLRYGQFTMIEIGVFQGASLRTWARYFASATIVGIDIDPEVARRPVPANVRVVIGDAGSPEVINSAVAEFGSPTIVVDDGSHYWHHQIGTLQTLWPSVLPGGFYIVEDVHTSFPFYVDEYRSKSNSKVTCYEYLMQLNRWVVGSRFMNDEKPTDPFIAAAWPDIDSIQWFRGTCVIRKRGSGP